MGEINKAEIFKQRLEERLAKYGLELIFKTVNAKLRGHYQYYGVIDNTREVKNFLVQTKWLLHKWMNRRSQKRSYTLDTFFKGLLRTFPLLELSIKVSLFYR